MAAARSLRYRARVSPYACIAQRDSCRDTASMLRSIYLCVVTTISMFGCGDSSSNQPVDAKLPTDAPDDNAPPITVVHGNVKGVGVNAMDAITTTATAKGFDFKGMSTGVLVSDSANACANQMTSTGVPNRHWLYFALGDINAAGMSSAITAPGTYSVSDGTLPASSKSAEAYFAVDGANCLEVMSAFATSGTVAVKSVSPNLVATFDVMFGTDHLTGSFSAPTCAALDPNRTPLNGC